VESSSRRRLSPAGTRGALGKQLTRYEPGQDKLLRRSAWGRPCIAQPVLPPARWPEHAGLQSAVLVRWTEFPLQQRPQAGWHAT
jgi:hypothetical protein